MVRLPAPILSDTTDNWVVDLAREVLSDREQQEWGRLPRSARRRRQWLAGRLAVKDAVRSLVEARTGSPVHRAAVEVHSDARGAPYVRLSAPDSEIAHLVVSIAHSGEVAVAMASEDRARGVGIDIELVRPRPALERKGLTPAERLALGELPEARRLETALQWWCAKEAAAKALRTGLDLLGGAQAIGVSPGPGAGLLQVEVAAAPGHRAVTLLAATRRDGDLVLATVVDVEQ